jgi:hypothetical protein
MYVQCCTHRTRTPGNNSYGSSYFILLFLFFFWKRNAVISMPGTNILVTAQLQLPEL